MTSTLPQIPQSLPQELVDSTTFLLKRLGFATKERSMKAYEEAGLHPYHFAILITVDEGSHETQAVSYTHLTLPTIYSV